MCAFVCAQDQLERNHIVYYWKHLSAVGFGCICLFVFEMCERLVFLVFLLPPRMLNSAHNSYDIEGNSLNNLRDTKPVIGKFV